MSVSVDADNEADEYTVVNNTNRESFRVTAHNCQWVHSTQLIPDLSDLEAATYIIQFTIETKEQSRKFVKR